MADTLPHLIVTGLGRCGTTMVMTMLDAGRFPVAGPRPAYEVSEAFGVGRADPDWIETHAGQAIKVVDPTICPIHKHPFRIPPVVICLTRDAKQQARSQFLFATGQRNPPAHDLGAMKRSIEQDTPRMIARLSTLTPHLYRLRFEDVLKDPYVVATLLWDISAKHFGYTFSPANAVRVVLDRPTTAMRDLRIEQFILPQLASLLPKEAAHG